MTRKHQSHTLGFRQLLVWVAIVCLLSAGELSANDRESIEKGLEIFQRQWVHKSPKLPEPLPGQTLKNRRELERRLMELPGDGLGPMHNATSCESCHAGGGAAGVDRNVTIRWHAGEASQSATRYRTLTRQGRAKVIAFLASLRAPSGTNRQKVDRTVEPALSFAKVSDSQNDLKTMAEALSVFDYD